MPINFLFNNLQATPTTPLPIQGSNTTSFSLELTVTRYLISSKGFCVGCILPRTVGNLNTVFLQCSLKVAPLNLPNTQHSIPLNQIFCPLTGDGLVFSQIQRRVDNP